jgi:predicted phosphodiesterase
MRIAIFSDVHGNLTALEAVLQDIKRESLDLLVFAGDSCVFGSRPKECVQILRDERIACVPGNTDAWISNKPLLSDDIEAEERARRESAVTAAEWSWAKLDEPGRAWLRTLPFYRRFSPTVHPQDDLLVVHANPKDLEQPIHPPEKLQEELYGEVKQPDEALNPLLSDVAAGVVAFGHIHVPNIRRWRGLTLANISSVSLPMDGDTRAKYGLLTWDNGWTIDLRRVPYDVDQEVELLTQLKPPKWRKLSRQLQRGVPD